jgi:ribonuclease VapC
MIVVDTSALMAIALKEAEADRCKFALVDDGQPLISAGTLAETLIVAARRGVGEEMARLIDALDLQVVNVTQASARRAASAYDSWGKGVHPAGLNFADCFAYELAREYDCPLLFIGDDFAKTDIAAA